MFPDWCCNWVCKIGPLPRGCKPHDFHIGVCYQFQVGNLRQHIVLDGLDFVVIG
jgi:hypothetical protein